MPAEQDHLLKKYNEIENREKKRDFPERRLINNSLIVILLLLTALIPYYITLKGENYLFYILYPTTTVLCISLHFANKSHIWANFVSAIIIAMCNVIVASLSQENHSDFVTLIDGITILIATNQFGKKGYTVGAIVVSIKMIVLYLIFPGLRYPQEVFAAIITANILGIFPLLFEYLAAISAKIEKQKIRAQILLIQNKDLLKNWKNNSDYGSTK